MTRKRVEIQILRRAFVFALDTIPEELWQHYGWATTLRGLRRHLAAAHRETHPDGEHGGWTGHVRILDPTGSRMPLCAAIEYLEEERDDYSDGDMRAFTV